MREFGAVLLAIVCATAVLFGEGIVVCILAIVTNGSVLVLLAGAGVGIPFAFYCGYRAAQSVLKSPSSEPIGPLPSKPRDPREEE